MALERIVKDGSEASHSLLVRAGSASEPVLLPCLYRKESRVQANAWQTQSICTNIAHETTQARKEAEMHKSPAKHHGVCTNTHTHTHTQQQQQTTQHSCKSSQKQNIGKYAQTGLPEGAQEHATPTKPPLRGSKKGEGVATTTGHHEATRPRAHRKARLVRRARTAVQAPSRSNLLPSTLHNLNVSRPVL